MVRAYQRWMTAGMYLIKMENLAKMTKENVPLAELQVRVSWIFSIFLFINSIIIVVYDHKKNIVLRQNDLCGSHRATTIFYLQKISALDADSLRRHLIDDHRFSYMDACSIVAKETPLGCNSLPTLVTPTSLQQEIPPESSLNCSKVNIIWED